MRSSYDNFHVVIDVLVRDFPLLIYYGVCVSVCVCLCVFDALTRLFFEKGTFIGIHQTSGTS